MSDTSPVVPELPPSAPRTGSGPFVRWLARSLLRLGGWRVKGQFPDLPKLMIIAAPLSSNWDGIWGMAAKIALGLRVHVLAKDALFFWPLGPVLRRLGAIPIDRSAAHGTVEQAIRLIRDTPNIYYVIAPEGTRKRVIKWKSGFLKIAHGAGVPVLMAYFHYPEKTIGIGELYWTTGDEAADMAAIREWYRPWQGKNRGTV